jgi:hypothetical protein
MLPIAQAVVYEIKQDLVLDFFRCPDAYGRPGIARHKKVFEKPSFLAVCQAGEEEANAHEIDERFSAACLTLVVLARAALPANSREGPLDDPAFGDDARSRRIAQIAGEIGRVAPQLAERRIDDLQAHAVLVCDPRDE